MNIRKENQQKNTLANARGPNLRKKLKDTAFIGVFIVLWIYNFDDILSVGNFKMKYKDDR